MNSANLSAICSGLQERYKYIPDLEFTILDKNPSIIKCVIWISAGESKYAYRCLSLEFHPDKVVACGFLGEQINTDILDPNWCEIIDRIMHTAVATINRWMYESERQYTDDNYKMLKNIPMHPIQ